MSELGANPTEFNTIRGVAADIALVNPDGKFDEYLSTISGYQTLYRMPHESLPYPIRDASLDYHREDSDDIDIIALVEFDPESTFTNNDSAEFWQSALRTKMAETLRDIGKDTYSLPHQPYDFYAKINDIYAVHIQFGTDTDTCHVAANLVTLEKLEAASNNAIGFNQDKSTRIVPPIVETLRELTAVWSLAIDTITFEFGMVEMENKPKANIVLGMTEKQDEPDFSPGKSLAIPTIEPPVEAYDPMAEQVPLKGFDMVGGLDHAKHELKKLVEIYRDPIGAKLYGVQAQPFLLYGPPGTGKSTLGRAVADELNAEFRLISSTDIIEKWVGSSGKNVKKFFNDLIKDSEDKVIVAFFDEFEALGSKGNLSNQERIDVKKQLNIAIEDIVANHPNVVLGAAVNTDIDDLEPSLVRSGRFKPIGAPLPNETERVDVWAAVLSRSLWSFSDFHRDAKRVASGDEDPILSFVPYADDIDPLELAKLTEGMTGADFDEMLNSARLKHFFHYRQTEELRKVSHADLIEEIRQFGR
jgi:SpoVK/Ycf46/Vps4 family AAA+-type ATPase